VETDPAKGSQAAPGDPITLRVSTGSIPLPDVHGKTEAQARQTLTAAGFSADQITSTTVERDDVPQGQVAATDPAAGTPVKQGQTINLQIAQPTPPQPTTTAPATTSAPASSSATASSSSAGASASKTG
jgi:serine/threonine-protein kinase